VAAASQAAVAAEALSRLKTSRDSLGLKLAGLEISARASAAWAAEATKAVGDDFTLALEVYIYTYIEICIRIYIYIYV